MAECSAPPFSGDDSFSSAGGSSSEVVVPGVLLEQMGKVKADLIAIAIEW